MFPFSEQKGEEKKEGEERMIFLNPTVFKRRLSYAGAFSFVPTRTYM